jgi:hypothetical protein
MDQLFILTEVIAQRREDHMHTFVAFLDLHKAYDCTWRAGIWQRLSDAGVTGRLWEAIRDTYRDVQSCVSIDGKRSKWFRSLLGVRQGAVLSPALFSTIINGLVEHLSERGFGIEIGGERRVGSKQRPGAKRLALLLFADDIALLANSEEELRQMMLAVDEFAQRWRFTFNASKCKVMAAGSNRSVDDEKREPWRINGDAGTTAMEEVDAYKYLGVDVQRNGQWQRHMARLTASATKRLPSLWKCGASHRGMRTRTARHLAEILVRPVLQYGAEIVWPTAKAQMAAERVMLQAARIVTGAGAGTLSDALRGELGWRSLEEMRTIRQLNYFHRLRTLPRTNLAAWLFEQRMAHTAARLPDMDGDGGGEAKAAAAGGVVRGFCADVRRVMLRYGIGEQWTSHTALTAADWAVVMRAVKERMNDEWRLRLHGSSDGKAYAAVKGREWRSEEYLNAMGLGARRIGGHVKFALRCGNAPLNATLFRKGKRAPSATCEACARGVDETREHLLLHCMAYDTLRAPMIAAAKSAVAEEEGHIALWHAKDDGERVVALLASDGRVDVAVQKFLAAAMTRRRALTAARRSTDGNADGEGDDDGDSGGDGDGEGDNGDDSDNDGGGSHDDER